MIIYGMGEKPITALCKELLERRNIHEIHDIPQTVYLIKKKDFANDIKSDDLILHSHEECLVNKKFQAVQQYEKYRRVEPSERGTAMFDEMLRLKRENMILEDENKTLKKKLQKAYDFMKRFTINGLNMLESFFAIYWGKNA